jgi:hypothetical protein
MVENEENSGDVKGAMVYPSMEGMAKILIPDNRPDPRAMIDYPSLRGQRMKEVRECDLPNEIDAELLRHIDAGRVDQAVEAAIKDMTEMGCNDQDYQTLRYFSGLLSDSNVSPEFRQWAKSMFLWVRRCAAGFKGGVRDERDQERNGS